MLLLFIQDNQARCTRSKYGASGADHHGGFPAANPLPLVIAFSGRQAAVQNSSFLSKVGCQQTQELGRQRNFWNQKHSALTQSQTMGNELDIDRSFTGAGDAVQQRNARILPCHLLRKILKAALLGGIQFQWAIQLGRLDLPAPQHGPFRQGHIAQLFQPVDSSHGSTCEIAQLLHRNAAQAAQQFQNRFLHGRGFGTLGGKFHSFFRRRCQGSNFFCLVSGFSLEIRL